MKNKNRIWIIPAVFFAVCCVLNLTGCLIEGDLERCVKPALMPLLCLSTASALLPKLSDSCSAAKAASLLFCGQLFGFAGDTMLLGNSFPFFAGGIGLFLIGHIFYICLFGGDSFKGLKAWQWICGIAGGLAVTALLVIVVGVNGVMLLPMGVYGFVLTMLIFSTLCGAVRFGGFWWMLLCGAVLFTFSDTLIAVRNFGNLSPFMGGFGVMFTYLLAQTLLAAGGVRLTERHILCK